jgi:hypothetical protein
MISNKMQWENSRNMPCMLTKVMHVRRLAVARRGMLPAYTATKISAWYINNGHGYIRKI